MTQLKNLVGVGAINKGLSVYQDSDSVRWMLRLCMLIDSDTTSFGGFTKTICAAVGLVGDVGSDVGDVAENRRGSTRRISRARDFTTDKCNYLRMLLHI